MKEDSSGLFGVMVSGLLLWKDLFRRKSEVVPSCPCNIFLLPVFIRLKDTVLIKYRFVNGYCIIVTIVDSLNFILLIFVVMVCD